MKQILFLIPFTLIYTWSLAQDRHTPTGVSVHAETGDTYSEPLIAAWDSIYKQMIFENEWDADILGSVSGKYNCHAYAWHMSDGGDTIVLPNDSDVAKYCTGDSATYTEADDPERKYVKVYYNGAQHSAIVAYRLSYCSS